MSDELGKTFSQLWNALKGASENADDDWRICSVATVGADGLPQVRKVVLRAVREDNHQLVFFTDPRSSKWKELVSNPVAGILFWSAGRQIQIRCSGEANLHQDNELALHYQEQVPGYAAGEYTAGIAPGEMLVVPPRDLEPDAKWNFGVVVLTVTKVDWLQLDRGGHRRAFFEKQDEDWLMNWVQP